MVNIFIQLVFATLLLLLFALFVRLLPRRARSGSGDRPLPVSLRLQAGAARRWRQGRLRSQDNGAVWRPRILGATVILPPGSTLSATRRPSGLEKLFVNWRCLVASTETTEGPVLLAFLEEHEQDVRNVLRGSPRREGEDGTLR